MQRLIRFLRLIFGLLTLVALIRQLVIHLSLGFNPSNFFSYYTILSNLFAGCVLIMLGLPIRVPAQLSETLRLISAVNMALVGIVFSVLLRNTDLGPLLPWVNFVHHSLMPCIVVLDWLLIAPRLRLGWRQLAISLSLPLIYLAYTLTRGEITGWYPYPFLNAKVAGGAGGVALYVLAITVALAIVGSALVAVGNWRIRKES